MLQNDYMIRQIDAIIEYIAETVLGKKKKEYNISIGNPDEIDDSEVNIMYLYQIADSGKINIAENLLFDKIENQKTVDSLEMGLSFYIYLNSKTDEFLEKHDFSRQEIIDGLNDLQKEYGLL
ncbi:MAG: DUF6483 family protein [Acutalibacteraceae bacterium]|nr:DUF6483 family protein [Acutalibacteraceae bacterium]